MPPKKAAKSNGDHQFQSGNTTNREEDKWKHAPPYEIHKDNNDFDPKWHGKCHCGKVKYQLSREKPLAAKYCHCTTCQRLHGAPFQWAAIFHKTDINFIEGIHDLGWYDPSSKSTTHHLPCKVSCAYCRTPIMDEGRNMILLFPPLIEEIASEEGRDAFKVQCHMFYKSRVVDFLEDGATKYEGLEKTSNILDDHGNLVDKWNEEEEKYESELGKGKEQNGDAEMEDESDGKKRKRLSDNGKKGSKKK